MNDNQTVKTPQVNKTPSEYFWIELEKTKTGYEKLSCKLNGKHYVGFLYERERKDKEGKAYGNYKLARMKECDWDDCLICYPNTILV